MKLTRFWLFLVACVLFLSAPDSYAASQAQTCPQNPVVQTMVDQVTQNSVAQWIRNFSGEDFVTIAGNQRKILTRFSTQLFNANNNALAFTYLGEQMQRFGYEPGLTQTDHAFTPFYYPTGLEPTVDLLQSGYKTQTVHRQPEGLPDPDQAVQWKNKVITIPGHGPNADEIVLLTAHMDSTSNNQNTYAPGAEDNGSGVAALMEAARLFRFYKFDRTIKLIFFTGEEQGLWGSEAYVSDHPAEMDSIIGVVNLDMFGYDNDKDMCIELHVGTRTDSNMVGTCFTAVNSNYSLGLTFDYLTDRAIRASDHASFWDANVGAIEVLENYQLDPSSYGCGGRQDRNPHYHKTTDTIDKMYLPATVATVNAGIGTVASLAQPLGRCFSSDPQLAAIPQTDSIQLAWPVIADSDVYNIYRSTTTCGGIFTQIAQVTTNSYLDTDIQLEKYYFYTVQAAETGAVCFSQMSNCAVARVAQPVIFNIFVPLVAVGE